MKLVTIRFNSGGLHEKHVVATCNLGNHLSKYTSILCGGDSIGRCEKKRYYV